MNNIIKLVAKDSVNINGREFTRVMGGFNENGIVITDKQIGDLLGYAKGSRQVRVQINNNISHFTDNDLKDVLHMDNNSEILKTLGYTNMQTSKAENIYILSQAGFLLYLKFAEGDKAIELYKNFIEDYFKTKAENIVMEKTLQETLKLLQDEKVFVLGSMFVEQDSSKKMELFNRSEVLNNKIKDVEITLSKENLMEQMQDTIAIADSFTNSDGLYDIGNFAKILDIKGLGRNNLFKWLKESKILMEGNSPYAMYSDYFKVIPVTKFGFTSIKPLLKSKGISFIVKRLIKEGRIEAKSYKEIIEDMNNKLESAS
jgi:hypothetical protein